MTPGDTIYALSSGNPPAAIAVVRVSGPLAREALRILAGRVPEPRRATAAALRHPDSGEVLDRGLVLFVEGPATATGEDVAELHLHGGRAVVTGVLGALAGIAGLRPAAAGEFTRRAFENGRIDLAEAEGLADLLAAETEGQRRAAMALAGGTLSRKVEAWQGQLLGLAAQVEAAADFSDEGIIREDLEPEWYEELNQLRSDVNYVLAAPAIERLKDGVRVVIAGPPNAGKSTLLNALSGRDAAITSATPGTTRDAIEAPTAIGGAPFLLVDTAGLRASGDEIEAIGVSRAHDHLDAADIVLWLGNRGDAPDADRSIVVQSKIDALPADPSADIRVSAKTGEGLASLATLLVECSRDLLPRPDAVMVNARHRGLLREYLDYLEEAGATDDLLVVAEALRSARINLDRITGRAGVEDMLDILFGRFCIGK